MKGSVAMLEPQTRAALTDQLAPPPGFTLSHGVGTTFTLDLATALSIPLSFASRRVVREDGSLGVLDAVRRAADRLDIFAQAGELRMGTPSALIAFLEQSIHQVPATRGLFHPKVWFLEYRANGGDTLRYRFLCASRNLTGDRSWDVIARFDGAPAATGSRREAIARNRPLVSLLKALPGLAVHPLAPERLTRLTEFTNRWRTVEFELPGETRNLTFHVFGIDARPTLNLSGARALIISPFVTGDGLAALRREIHGPTHLLSRPETLDHLAPSSLDQRLRTYVLDAAASFPDDTDDDRASGAVSTHPADRLLSGLHAKVIVVDRQDGAHVLLGSANATGAALRSNVEVMVELTAPGPRFGVRATIDALGALIEPFQTRGGVELDPSEEAEHALESHLRRFAGVPVTMRLVDADPYGLEVWSERDPAVDVAIDLRWHLITRPDIGGLGFPGPASAPETMSLAELSDITPFIVLVARDHAGRERSTVLLARLIDDLPHRREAVIARQLTDTASFVRLLTLLLELQGVALPTAEDGGAGSIGTFGRAISASGAGLFEALVRAVGSGQSGLQDVRSIVDYLASLGQDKDIRPPGFEDLWASVWAAHERLLASKVGR